MPAVRHADRIWLGAGVVGSALLLVLAYFLLIAPLRAEAESLTEQTAVTEVRVIALRQRLVELEKQQAKLPQYEATLKRNEAALPRDSGVPDFLRQLQQGGNAAGAEVITMNVSEPTQVAGVTNVWGLPIAVTVDGTADELGRFLDQLQRVQPRAVLVQRADLSSASSGNAMTLTLTLTAFTSSGANAPAGGNAPAPAGVAN